MFKMRLFGAHIGNFCRSNNLVNCTRSEKHNFISNRALEGDFVHWELIISNRFWWPAHFSIHSTSYIWMSVIKLYFFLYLCHPVNLWFSKGNRYFTSVPSLILLLSYYLVVWPIAECSGKRAYLKSDLFFATTFNDINGTWNHTL